MKKNINNTIIIGFLMIVCIAFFTACEEEGPNFRTFDYPELVVDDFSPKSGRPGTLVSITGSNFGEVVGAAHIFFNGVEIAADNITSYSDTEIVVKVPEEATSGLITINVWKHTKVTAESFEFIEGAKYTTVNPSIAQVGETVTITGENFGTDAGAVQLFIGSVAVDVASVSDTEITFVVPDISSGSLVLNIDGQEITGDYFFIGTECYIPLYPTGTNLCPDPEMTDISLWNGWGGKREVVTGSGAYCGASYMKIVGNGIVGNCGYPGANGEGSALDINLTWEANATYRLHVWVKTIGGSIGFLASRTDPNVEASYDTLGEWQLIDETFTTGSSPNTGSGASFISFNTCDSGANATEVHIDNYQLYRVDTLGLDDVISAVSSNVNASGNRIFISNVKAPTEVQIYSVTGALVKSLNTNTDTDFNFRSGLWIVTTKTLEGQKSVKLLVK